MTKSLEEQIESTQEQDQQYVLQPWSKQSGKKNRVITKSQGASFWDQAGNHYYDMSSQLVYANLGHKHPKMVKAIAELGDNQIVATGFASASKSTLAKQIVDVAPANMSKVYFTMAGAEANEHAMKIVRMVTNKTKIFSRYRSYHGSTYGAGGLTGEGRRFAVEPGVTGLVKFPTPYPYRDDFEFDTEEAYTQHYLTLLEAQLNYEGPENVAAVFVEPIPGSNGVILPPKGYLKGVEEICRRLDVLLVCDEVMTGFGRTGEWFAVNHYDVQPDIITFAKGVTAGYLPLGGVIVSEKIAQFFDDNTLMTGSTYSGHALSCAVGVAALTTYHEDRTVEYVKKMEPILSERLTKLLDYQYVGDVRNIGLFASIELVKNKETKEPILAYGKDYGKDPDGYMAALLGILNKNGFYTYGHESCIFVSPPLVISEDELHQAMDVLEESLTEFATAYPELK